jgi:hypothetical protein
MDGILQEMLENAYEKSVVEKSQNAKGEGLKVGIINLPYQELIGLWAETKPSRCGSSAGKCTICGIGTLKEDLQRSVRYKSRTFKCHDACIQHYIEQRNNNE